MARWAQIIVQKTIGFEEKATTLYEIGLMAYDKSLASDDFMKSKTIIMFDDDSIMQFDDPISINYLYSGKHQIYVRHSLTNRELRILQTKEIKMFRIYNHTKIFDKWQPGKIKTALIKIGNEKL